MGCGGSTFAEDGSVNLGKGEMKLELDEAMVLQIMMMYPDECSKYGVEVKGANGKELLTAPWVRACDGTDKTLWAEVKPGKYMFRFVADERRCNHHEDPGLMLPEKIWAVHSKAPIVFTKMCYLFSKGKEGCPYAAANGEELCKADLDKMEHYVSSHQLAEFLDPLRKALTTIEDLMPGNQLDATADPTYDLGYWDKGDSGDVRVLTGMQSARLMGEAKLNNPKQMRMITMKAAEIIRKMIIQAMDATCKTIKMTKEELLPTLDQLLDIMEGRKPGSILRKVEADTTEYDDVTPATIEKERLELIEKMWAADKSNMMRIKAEDMAPEFMRKKVVEHYAEKFLDKLKKHYTQPFDPKKVTKGTWAMARYKGTEMYEAQAGDTDKEGNIMFTWPETKLEETETLPVKPVEKVKVKRGFPPKEVEEERINVGQMPPGASIDDLQIGMPVRFRSERWGNFLDGKVYDIKAGKAIIKDKFNEINLDVTADRIWIMSKLVDIAKTPRVIQKHFYPISFWWIENDADIIAVKVNVWRVGAREETLQTVEMESIKKQAKPTKQVPEPTHQVHVGYRATAQVMLARDYAVNFVKKYNKKQGEAKVEAEETFIDYGVVAKNEFSFRRFSMKLNIAT